MDGTVLNNLRSKGNFLDLSSEWKSHQKEKHTNLKLAQELHIGGVAIYHISKELSMSFTGFVLCSFHVITLRLFHVVVRESVYIPFMVQPRVHWGEKFCTIHSFWQCHGCTQSQVLDLVSVTGALCKYLYYSSSMNHRRGITLAMAPQGLALLLFCVSWVFICWDTGHYFG